jgi:sugar O-acyltransferase (sialic acid O-acetyltransferase NeuD family)
MIAISDSSIRQKVVESLPSSTKFFSYIHPSTIISGNVKISEGTFIGPNCILTNNISLGSHCLLNRGNQVGHDCVIGNFFSMMPGSVISGNNNIGNCVYFGVNSCTKEKIQIVDHCVFGLNSGVIKHVTESGVYVGTPVKKIY